MRDFGAQGIDNAIAGAYLFARDERARDDNVLYHVVNDRHIRRRSMIFTTNKPPKTRGAVLHDDDLAEAIVDRILERGRLLRLDGPSVRTKHLPEDQLHMHDQDVTGDRRVSGKQAAEFPERTNAPMSKRAWLGREGLEELHPALKDRRTAERAPSPTPSFPRLCDAAGSAPQTRSSPPSWAAPEAWHPLRVYFEGSRSSAWRQS
jgi:hypothetical protein